jgi:hypothetical protein
MQRTERVILETLDGALKSREVDAALRQVVSRVRAQLARDEKALMAWEAMPLQFFGNAVLPVPSSSAIRSSWVFILRAGVNTGAERHPNSHQRMMSFTGGGDMQVRSTLDSPWRSNVLVSDSSAPLEQRWISIPPNVWHQPVVAPAADWVVVSFHTVPAEELIEERPDSAVDGGTKQMRYLG